MSTRTSRPSIAELRAVTQPASIFERNSGEHWAGRLYVRRLSPYLTALLLRTPITPNGVTWLMIVSGLAAAAVLTLPGLLPAIGASLLIQLQIALDCSDGELARWLNRKSAAGVFLDRLGHELTEAALPIALGIRADGGWDEIGGWTTLGALLAVVVLLVKAETMMVNVARIEAGLEKAADTREVATPRGLLGRLRRLAGHLPFYRAFVAVEATLLALAAAIVDLVVGDLEATRILLLALLPTAVVTFAGHLAAILRSKRL